jgi:CHASE3 domain sensor protein
MWRECQREGRLKEAEIIVQKKEGTTTYKMVRQCGDGIQRLERKRRGQSRLEESCEGGQSPPRAVVLLLLLTMMMMTMTMICFQKNLPNNVESIKET